MRAGSSPQGAVSRPGWEEPNAAKTAAGNYPFDPALERGLQMLYGTKTFSGTENHFARDQKKLNPVLRPLMGLGTTVAADAAQTGSDLMKGNIVGALGDVAEPVLGLIKNIL